MKIKSTDICVREGDKVDLASLLTSIERIAENLRYNQPSVVLVARRNDTALKMTLPEPTDVRRCGLRATRWLLERSKLLCADSDSPKSRTACCSSLSVQ